MTDEDEEVQEAPSRHDYAYRRWHRGEARSHKRAGLKASDHNQRHEHFYAACMHLAVANHPESLTGDGLAKPAGHKQSG